MKFHAQAKNAAPMTKEYGGIPIMSQLHTTSSFMSLYILGAPNRAAAAGVAAELGMVKPDPAEFARPVQPQTRVSLCDSFHS